MDNVELFETADLGFAAYLKMTGLKLIELGRKETERKFKFIFECNGHDIGKLKVDFVNSESYKFDSNMKGLRIMLKTAMEKE